MRNATEMGSPALLHGLLNSDNGSVSYYANHAKDRPTYVCLKGASKNGWVTSNAVGIMRQQRAWSVVCEDVDHIVIKRLCELSQYDADISDRIQAFWDKRKSEEVDEAELLLTQIEKAEAQIHHLDSLLTNPAAPLSADTQRRFIGLLHEAEADVQRLSRKHNLSLRSCRT
jgi:hypothetical protein